MMLVKTSLFFMLVLSDIASDAQKVENNDDICGDGKFLCKGSCINVSETCEKDRKCIFGSFLCETLKPKKGCVLPPYPENGSYNVTFEPDAVPGQRFDNFELTVTCDPGYDHGENRLGSCYKGDWTQEMPKCTPVMKSTNCSLGEFKCNDDTCISTERICDGTRDCADGGDEVLCGSKFTKPISTRCMLPPQIEHGKYTQIDTPANESYKNEDVLNLEVKCDPGYGTIDGSSITYCVNGTWRKELPLCHPTSDLEELNKKEKLCGFSEYRCNDDTCISTELICDGIDHCPDKSDEKLCAWKKQKTKNKCKLPPYPDHGTYTVDGAPNAVPGHEIDIADLKVSCNPGYVVDGDNTAACAKGQWTKLVPKCSSTTISITDKTNLATCSSSEFKCKDSTCISSGQVCNGFLDCFDGSDESSCGPKLPKPTSSCVLPPHPDHGSYIVTDAPNAIPGQEFDAVEVNVTCHAGYGTLGSSFAYCFKGRWITQLPRCIQLCKLMKHVSVEYNCILSGTEQGFRLCGGYEPHGTQVIPRCRSPNYYAPTDFHYMTCINGNWDYIAKCSPECGKITPDGEQLIVDGRSAMHGELPWHAGIYTKTSNPYKQICGGSLVSKTVIITAAHCFWDDIQKLLPAENYAVAVGKIYRPWSEPNDKYAQKSDVKKIKVSDYFFGGLTNFQDDIALVVVSKPFEYKTYVRPICLDFGQNFERTQLQVGNLGKVAGWGLTLQDGKPSPVLKVVNLPYVDIGTCISKAPGGFKEYITSDKICAGYGNGTALCKGDSGGGLVFPHYDKFIERYYLRGIVSTAPNNEHLCNAFTLTAFTRIISHEHFIKKNVRPEE